MRKWIARKLRALAEKFHKTRRVEVDIYGPANEIERALTKVGKEQVRVQQDIAKQGKRQHEAVMSLLDHVLLENPAQTNGNLASGQRVRIESDGVGINTKLWVGDELITNATRVTWSVSVEGCAHAIVELIDVPVAVVGETA